MKQAAIKKLLANPAINTVANLAPSVQGISTGYKILDKALYNKGWPENSLSEILYDQFGLGDLILLLPTLKLLTEQDSITSIQSPWVFFINAPHIPYPPLLINAGIDLKYIVMVDNHCTSDQLWAAEQILQSGHTVLLWETDKNYQTVKLRRLQLACQQGHSQCFLFRNNQHINHSSPACLRIKILKQYNVLTESIKLQIIKNKGQNNQSTIEINSEFRPKKPITMAELGLHSAHLFCHQHHHKMNKDIHIMDELYAVDDPPTPPRWQ